MYVSTTAVVIHDEDLDKIEVEGKDPAQSHDVIVSLGGVGGPLTLVLSEVIATRLRDELSRVLRTYVTPTSSTNTFVNHVRVI